MIALSVNLPYAAKIAEKKKTIETRTWATNHRGPLLICATKKPPGPNAGNALCIVDLVDVRSMSPYDATAACIAYDPNLFAWIFNNIRQIIPFPVRGQQRLFNIHPNPTILYASDSGIMDPT